MKSINYSKAILLVILLLQSSITVFAHKNNIKHCRPKLTFAHLKEQIRNRHPMLKVANIDINLADANLTQKKGKFDHQISISSLYRRFNSSSAIGSAQEAIESQLLLSKLTRYGIQMGLGGKRNNWDIKTPISPTGDDGDYFLKIGVPLLQGAGTNQSYADESQAFLKTKQAINHFKTQELSLLLQAAHDYWSWVASAADVSIEKELYKLANFQLKSVSSHAHSGDLPKITIVEAKQELARREGRIQKAKRKYQQALYKIAWYLWNDKSTNTRKPSICEIPQHFYKIRRFSNSDLKKARLNAIRNRPELKNLHLSKIIYKIDKDLAQNYLLPKLDLKLQAGRQFGTDRMHGISGNAGIEISSPIERREAKGKLNAALNEIEKMQISELQLVQRIFLQLDDALSAINMNYLRYQAAQRELNYARQIEHGERVKFKHGDSTLFVVNRRERASAEAASRLNHIKQDYYDARTCYEAFQGIL